MSDLWRAALDVLPLYLSQHILLCASALGLALALAAPLTILALRSPGAIGPMLGAASLIQTIPGLALMAAFYPLLLALSTLTGLALPALGFLPALLALTLYALLPILRNAIAGLRGVDADVLEAARAVGMTPRQIATRVQIPLAAPVVMAGVRTAAVWTIGAGTLATPIGQVTLGNYIFAGLQTENWVSVLFGCALSAAVALAADAALGLIERGLSARRPMRVALGALALAIGVAASLAPLARGGATYVIGAKNFSEQFILAEAIGQRLAAEGASARKREGLGSSVIYRALANGDIDVYVDYAGTLWANVLGRTDAPPRAEMAAEIARALEARDKVGVAGALGFENAYVLAMRRARAEELGVRTLEDLARLAPRLTLGSDLEFLDRPEWRALRDAYGLGFAQQKSYNPTFMYRALAAGDVDVISAFSSDGRIAAEDLVLLADPKGAIPSYDALVLVAPARRDDALLRRALRPLIGAITPEAMRNANLDVDRDADKLTPARAARNLLEATK